MIIFHHNDMDGRCAGAVAYHWGLQNGHTPITLIEVDYTQPPPIDRVKAGDLVVIVDFSFQPETMQALFARSPSDVIWIDHHQSAARYDYGRTLKGLRDNANKGPAACELTWIYFYPDRPLPRGIALISDLDAWRLALAPDCFQFHEGLRLHNHLPNAPIWEAVIASEPAFLCETLDKGQLCLAYRDNYSEDLCLQLGYETTFAGHAAFACNLARLGSRAFGNRLERYPLCISYNHDGRQFSVTLYTARPDLDVATICQQYGGGGHRQAAGFTCQTLPFVPTFWHAPLPAS
jgi:oligoribonuclease NrnB/cAMP/cGMP phosphodiesterase (DHH superfamily)